MHTFVVTSINGAYFYYSHASKCSPSTVVREKTKKTHDLNAHHITDHILTYTSRDVQQWVGDSADRPRKRVRTCCAVCRVLAEGPYQRLVQVDYITLITFWGFDVYRGYGETSQNLPQKRASFAVHHQSIKRRKLIGGAQDLNAVVQGRGGLGKHLYPRADFQWPDRAGNQPPADTNKTLWYAQ